MRGANIYSSRVLKSHKFMDYKLGGCFVATLGATSILIYMSKYSFLVLGGPNDTGPVVDV